MRVALSSTLLALAALLAHPARPAVFTLPSMGTPSAVTLAGQQRSPGATPTRLVVRVVSQDAKVIGSGVGGARVTVRDAESGRVLAEGVHGGGTGDTGAIMGPRQRGATVFDRPGTASFEATLALERPTLVRVEARGPLETPHAEQEASATLLMVPGVDIAGEGLVLTLHGFTVVIETPEEPSGDAVAGAGGPIPVRANVTMLCGCPIESGGTWDADRIEVTARLVRGDAVVAEERLSWAGEPNTFAGEIQAPSPGAYELQVVAVDPERANAGMDRRTLEVRD